jgi:hypothetical protein
MKSKRTLLCRVEFYENRRENTRFASSFKYPPSVFGFRKDWLQSFLGTLNVP